MRAKDIGFNFFLEADKIDLASEKIMDFLQQLALEHREALRIQLSTENILLAWQERFGKSAQVRLSCYSRMGQPLIRLQLDGDAFDPLEQSGDASSLWEKHLLSQMETRAAYSYIRGVNTITFRIVMPKRSPLVLLLFSLAAAALVGIAGGLLPPEARVAIAEQWLTPICTTYLNVLSFCGIPLIFLSVALGIRGIDDVNMFGRIGKKMVLHYFLVLLATTLLAAAAAYPMFRFIFGGSSLNIAYTDLLEMVLGWLPTSLLQPFLDCNAMQLILMGFIFGIGLLKLDPLARNLAGVLDDLQSLLLLVAEWFTRLIPVFVFIIIVKSFWLGQMSEILPAWKSWAVTSGLQATALLVMALQICRKNKVRLSLLLKKVSATFLIALGTNSCAASITESYACCGGKLGIDGKVFGFGIPIGTSIFKPSSAIRLIVLVFYMASTYQVGVSAEWFVMAILMTVMLSIAVPAIPGGTLMFCPMLFAQLGLPAEALTPMLATDIFFDAVCTAFNQVSVQMALIQQADVLGMLERDALRQ